MKGLCKRGGLLWLAGVVSLPLAALGISSTVQAAQDDPRLTGPVELLSAFPDGMPVLMVEINGEGPFRLALDLVGTSCTLDATVGLGLDLITGVEEIGGGSTGIPRRTIAGSRFDTLTVGPLIFKNVKVFYRATPGLTDDSIRIHGTIPASIFADSALTVDRFQRKVSLRPSTLFKGSKEDAVSYRIQGYGVVIPVAFGKAKTDVSLDFTYDGAFRLADTVKDMIKISPDDGGRDIGDTRAADIAHLGAYEIHRAPVRFGPGSSVMGRRLLKRFVLTLDSKRQLVYLKRKTGRKIEFVPPGPKFGLEVKKRQRDLVVSKIEEGSPAWRSGIQVGDTLLYVNYQPASYHSLASFRRLMSEATDIDMKIRRGRLDLMLVMIGPVDD